MLLATLAPTVHASSLPLPNAGFEQGLVGWRVEEPAPMSTVHPEAAFVGERGLRVIDDSEAAASSVSTPRFPVEPGFAYRLTLRARRVSGQGIAVYLRFFDAKGRQLNPWPKYSDLRAVESSDWRQITVMAAPPEGAVSVDVRIRSYTAARVVADFDDVSLEAVVPSIGPPWTPAYKLDPSNPADAARLTEADVPGPDGLVYPNWKYVGVPGGIPAPDSLPVAVPGETFAALEDRDISGLLQSKISEVGANGGGVIELPPGRFLLAKPVIVRDSGVVIRGAGKARTHLLFTDRIPYGTLRAWSWNPSDKIGPNGFFEIQANPKNLNLLRVTSGGVLVAEELRRKHWGDRFHIRMRGEVLLARLGPGRHRLDAEIGYDNGDVFRDSFEVEVAAEPQPGDTWADEHGALVIAGAGLSGPRIPLAATAARGGRLLPLAAGHGLRVGDRVMIEAPATPRWNKLTGNMAPWGTYRSNHYEIVEVVAEGVRVSEPLRLEFPVEDGAYVQRIRVVESSGFEGLTVEQEVITREPSGPKIPDTGWYAVEDLWTDGVTFTYAWGCWLRDVGVINAGRNPVYLKRSKRCEARDLEIDGAIFHGGGGTAYVGFERTFDSLMDGVVTRRMRHAPDVQWGAAGNVIRNGQFIGSDGQWHAGWTNENLFENNIIEQTEADMAHGSYGHGLFASGPGSPYHGPQGPRNVVYNNDIVAPKDGLHMVGGNEAWLILHNRFVLGKGRAIYGREKTFDHIIRGNVFVMEQPASPAVLFGASDCTGIELVDNAFYGPIGQLAGFIGNLGRFEKLSGNTVAPYPKTPDAVPARPQPAVPSIFEWQRRTAATP